ncbi:putative isomerase YbhE [Rostrohypoxylon terebratum]|nr:putative isomerase YbhE [Rostrohypoxylon terebratum]
MATQGQTQAFRTLVVGCRDQVLVVRFDGTKFTITRRYVKKGSVHCWMLSKGETLYAVDAVSDEINLFNLDKTSAPPPTTNTSSSSISSFKGSHGGVHLAFNADQTRIVDACYRSSRIDVWDCSNADGSLKLIKSLEIPGKPSPGRNHHRPHQAVLDPSGRFFVVPNLSGDTLLFIDTANDLYEITSTLAVFTGFGPRRVEFVQFGEKTLLVILGELSNQVLLYEGSCESAVWTPAAQCDTYNGATKPADAKAGELVVAGNKEDVYLSNRNTGEAEDHIAHFKLRHQPNNNNSKSHLEYINKTPTCGRLPRSFCLSKDPEQNYVFVGNEKGEWGLVAFRHDPATGLLDPNPVARLANVDLTFDNVRGVSGPQFVDEF